MDLRQLRGVFAEATNTAQQIRLAAGAGAGAALRVEANANETLASVREAADAVKATTIGLGLLTMVCLTIVTLCVIRAVE